MSLPRFLSLGLLALAACATSPTAPPASASAPRAGDSYGLVPENPVRVGGGPQGQRAYLEALRGPGGELVVSRRIGHCCEFETPLSFGGWGVLDVYEVTYEGLDTPVRLYLNMYDAEPVHPPPGFLLEGIGGSAEGGGAEDDIQL